MCLEDQAFLTDEERLTEMADYTQWLVGMDPGSEDGSLSLTAMLDEIMGFVAVPAHILRGEP